MLEGRDELVCTYTQSICSIFVIIRHSYTQFAARMTKDIVVCISHTATQLKCDTRCIETGMNRIRNEWKREREKDDEYKKKSSCKYTQIVIFNYSIHIFMIVEWLGIEGQRYSKRKPFRSFNDFARMRACPVRVQACIHICFCRVLV